MQSTTFRLLSIALTITLLLGLGAVIMVVLQQNSPTSIADQPVRQQTRVTATAIQVSAQSITATNSSVVRTVQSETQSSVLRPTPRREAIASPTTTRATPEPAILRPTATPTPIVAMQTPVDFADRPQPGWSLYSNGNQLYDLTVLNTTIWAATGGGVVAWNRSNNAAVKYTTLDGLAANRTTAVVNCPLAGFGLIFGTDHGLQLFDTRRGTWRVLNSRNSDLHYDDIATLNCSVEHGFLVVGYRQHGLDIFDEEVGEWRLINRSSGLQRDLVDTVAVVGDLDALWVSSGFEVSVLTADGAFFYDRNNSPLEAEQISLIGRSLGSGVAVYLAAHRKVDKLILLTPYDSIVEVARMHYPFIPVRYFARDRFEAFRFAPEITAPILMVTAGLDRVVPAERALKLREYFSPSLLTYRVIDSANHNNITEFSEYRQLLFEFLAEP